MTTARDGAAPRVTITQELGVEAVTLFDRALADAGFWTDLDRVRQAAAKSPTVFRIIIKPDLDWYDPAAPTGTEPALVEHLIDLLHDRGYSNVTVGDGRNEEDGWLHNRGPAMVPDLVGYRFVTPKGRSYDVVDLRADPLPSNGDRAVFAVAIGEHWAKADYRINFAKNKTHETLGYALCLYNLLGAVASSGNARADRDAVDDCVQLLRTAPAHFNLIDAYTSAHGAAGHRAPQRLETHAFIGCVDALLADWAGAAKMGLDPYASPLNAVALQAVGLPRNYEIAGSVAPYPLWRNVHPLIADSARRRSRAEGLGSLAAAWFQATDRTRFPHRDFFSDRINSFVVPRMNALSDDARAFWAMVLLNRAIAWIDGVIESQRTLFAKDTLRRRVAPLRLDAAALDPSEYEAIRDELRPFKQLLTGLPRNRCGLRWRRVEDSVIFEASHVFPIAFDDFVAAVDIKRSIQYMNDYIGGSALAVRKDERGRVTHQAERNLYLQQPNWLVLFAGDLIDVEKIESIQYREDRHDIAWRTVGSPNGSAKHDDGDVSFVRSSGGTTEVRIFARQQFTLPMFFRVFDVNLLPEIRDPIIETAYSTFFTRTIANLQAAYDGRDFRIGREMPNRTGHGAEGPSLARVLATGAAAIGELLRHRGDVGRLSEFLFSAVPAIPLPGVPAQSDAHGFAHFGPQAAGTTYLGARADAQATIAGLAALARDAPDYAAGLADAVYRDLDAIARAMQEKRQ